MHLRLHLFHLISNCGTYNNINKEKAMQIDFKQKLSECILQYSKCILHHIPPLKQLFHYDKSCLLKPHYFGTKTQKKLIYNIMQLFLGYYN